MLTLSMLSSRLSRVPDEVLAVAALIGAPGRVVGHRRLWDLAEAAKIGDAMTSSADFETELIRRAAALPRVGLHLDPVTGERWYCVTAADWERLAGMIPKQMPIKVVRTEDGLFAVHVSGLHSANDRA